MSILTTIYTRSGEVDGMPMIMEVGICDNDTGTLNQLRSYENEALQITRIPRRSGLTVKNLAGSAAPRTQTIAAEHLGRFENCVQVGRTETQLYAPRQPIGQQQGKCLLTYRRQWLSLGNDGSAAANQTPPGE